MNPTSDTPAYELRKVELKFDRFTSQRSDGTKRILWLASAVLTYISPIERKRKIGLPELGALTTAQKKKLIVRFCPTLLLIESPNESFHWYNRQGEHITTIPTEEAGSFDTFTLSIDNGEPQWELCGASFRKGDSIRVYNADGTFSHIADTGE